MTEFSKLMDKLGWSDAGAATELGRTVSHIRNMYMGRQKPHDHTILYMEVLVENRELKSRLKRRKE